MDLKQSYLVAPDEPPELALAIASGGTRFVAGLIDTLVLAVLTSVAARILPGLVSLMVGAAYTAILMAHPATQGTLGMLAMKIRIVDEKGDPIPMRTSLIRLAMSYVSAAIFMIGFLMLFFSERRQTLHDKVAGTLVVMK